MSGNCFPLGFLGPQMLALLAVRQELVEVGYILLDLLNLKVVLTPEMLLLFH